MHITDRIHSKKWGVFHHYLYNIQNNPLFSNNQNAGKTDWQTCTQALDVRLLAKTLHEIGAGYYFITVMQGRKYMIAENAAYRAIVGDAIADDCLSQRDLIEELYQELSKYDIDLYLYFTGDGPYKDESIGKLFGFIEPRKNISMDFVKKWSEVLKEYSIRYGKKVKGWWLDGMYQEEFGYTPELMQPYYQAIKAGNPDAIVAFNNGVKSNLYRYFPEEEFTSGEQIDLSVIPEERFCAGAQAHILLPIGAEDRQIGATWAGGGLNFTKEVLADYAQKVISAGGVVSFDCKLNRDGSMDSQQIKALQYMNSQLS